MSCAPQCWTALAREFNPVGFVENLLVRSLARRAAQILVDEQSYDDAVERAEQAFARLSAPVADETALESASLLRARLGMAEQLAAFDRRNAAQSRPVRPRASRPAETAAGPPRSRTTACCGATAASRPNTSALPISYVVSGPAYSAVDGVTSRGRELDCNATLLAMQPVRRPDLCAARDRVRAVGVAARVLVSCRRDPAVAPARHSA